MLYVNEFMSALEERAPLSISKAAIAAGGYDNSGVIVLCSDEVKKVLFSLDLTEAAVGEAERYSCDTIVTHHPAVYRPIKTLGTDVGTRATLAAATKKMNVVSMHLNLDMADEGIDFCLAKAAGAKEQRIIKLYDGVHGYGREFAFDGTVEDLENGLKSALKTERTARYGSGKINTVATFCGGGASDALEYVLGGGAADAIVTSDAPHHVIEQLTEAGKAIVLVAHYAAEEYGFEKFYRAISRAVSGKAEVRYFCDKRFK